jgi:hypothetical protein
MIMNYMRRKKSQIHPNQRVYRQGQTVKQANRGDHDCNTDEGSDSYKTLLPHTASGTMVWIQQTGATNTRIYQFTGDKPGKRQNVAPHSNKDSTPDSVFMVYCAAMFCLLVDETNC